MDPADADRLAPHDLAVQPDGAGQPPGFPRPAGWRPTAPIRLLARQAGPGDGPGWVLTARHRPEDAATAEIRPAVLVRPAPGRTLAVVLKLQRIDPAQNISPEAVAARFDREQRALRHLAAQLPTEAAACVPATWNPAGTPRAADRALRLAAPVLFCLAAHHALRLDDAAGRADLTTEGLRQVVGADPSACRGCPHFRHADRPADDPIPEGCRPWLVALREPGGWEHAVSPVVPALLLTDLGPSLQQAFDQVPAGQNGGLTPPPRQGSLSIAANLGESFSGRVDGLRGLARTLDAVHRAGWLHLDLNPDNLCLDTAGDGPQLRVIDFGHAEPLEGWSTTTIQDRIPLRRTDFAAPEMQMRSFPLRVRWLSPDPGGAAGERLEALGLTGWPPGWRPHARDLVEVAPAAGGRGAGGALYRIQSLRVVGGRRLELAVTAFPPRPGEAPPAPPGGPLDATVYRSPGPAADLYAFGLLLLCWVMDLQKPVVLRDELAFFERAIPWGRTAAGAAVTLGDDTWLQVYRRVFGLHCMLLDEVFPWWAQVLARAVPRREDRDRLTAAFRQVVRVGIKCIVRHRGWVYGTADHGAAGAPGATCFTAVAQDLEAVAERLRDPAVAAVERLPESFEGFRRWIRGALPTALTAGQRRGLRAAQDQVGTAVTALRRAGAAFDQARLAFAELRLRVGDLSRHVRREYELYAAAYRAAPWWARNVWWPLRDRLRPPPAPGPLPPDDAAADLVHRLRAYAAAVPAGAAAAVTGLIAAAEAVAGELTAFQADAQRRQFGGAERGRAAAAAAAWERWQGRWAEIAVLARPEDTTPAAEARTAAAAFSAGLADLRRLVQDLERQLTPAGVSGELGARLDALPTDDRQDARLLVEERRDGHRALMRAVQDLLPLLTELGAGATALPDRLLGNDGAAWSTGWPYWNRQLKQLWRQLAVLAPRTKT